MTRITEQESSILKTYTTQKKLDKSAAHSKKSPMLRHFLTDYIQADLLCLQCPMSLHPHFATKNSDWGFLPRTQTEGAQKSFPT